MGVTPSIHAVQEMEIGNCDASQRSASGAASRPDVGTGTTVPSVVRSSGRRFESSAGLSNRPLAKVVNR